MSVTVSEIAVANPDSSFTQDEMLDLLGLADDGFAQGVFARNGVATRHFERLDAEHLATTLQERTPHTEEQLLGLAIRAIDQLQVDPAQIGTLITATYYSLGGPTLAHRLLEHYGMDPATDKYHLVGVGCASAVPLFRLASQSMRDHPGRHALVVAAESITGFITPVAEGEEATKTIGFSLFGDGCGAAVLRAGDGAGGPEILGARVHQVGGSLGTVRFRVEAADSFMHMGRDLPAVAREQLGGLVDDFLRANGVDRDAIAHWLLHPGGRGIVDAAQEALALDDEDVAVSRDVLRRFGNMGTPTSFYVLRETIVQRAPAPGDLGLMVSIGPGVTVGLMLLRY